MVPSADVDLADELVGGPALLRPVGGGGGGGGAGQPLVRPVGDGGGGGLEQDAVCCAGPRLAGSPPEDDGGLAVGGEEEAWERGRRRGGIEVKELPTYLEGNVPSAGTKRVPA